MITPEAELIAAIWSPERTPETIVSAVARYRLAVLGTGAKPSAQPVTNPLDQDGRAVLSQLRDRAVASAADARARDAQRTADLFHGTGVAPSDTDRILAEQHEREARALAHVLKSPSSVPSSLLALIDSRIAIWHDTEATGSDEVLAELHTLRRAIARQEP